MPGTKTNEIEGTRAVLRHSRMSAYKVREVLNLIRGKDVALAAEILRFSERDAAREVGKLLASAIANAENNDQMDPEELYVSTCYADEGGTIKRWRPRARGRASRIRKRTCHVTVIVSRLPEDRLQRIRARQAADMAVRRSRRVAGQRQSDDRRRRTGGRVAGPDNLSDSESNVAAIEEAEGIVDPQGAAIEATEAAGIEEVAALPEVARPEPEVPEPGSEVGDDQPAAVQSATEATGSDPQTDAGPSAEATETSSEEGK